MIRLLYIIRNISFRLNSLVRLEYKQREDFVDMYGVASTHILQERFRQYPVAYGLQKDSLFAQKIGAIIGWELAEDVLVELKRILPLIDP